MNIVFGKGVGAGGGGTSLDRLRLVAFRSNFCVFQIMCSDFEEFLFGF